MEFQIFYCPVNDFSFPLRNFLGIHALRSRIIGGVSANIQEFPYIVSFRNIEDNIHFCAGSIISHWNVLSAAHCFIEFENEFDDVRMYSGTSSSFDVSGPTFTIQHIVFHIDYQRPERLDFINLHDIAIIKTNEHIEFNQFQNKINLPTRDIFEGNIGRIVGWGVTTYPHGGLSPFLRQASVDIVDHILCTQIVPMVINETQFCAIPKMAVATGSGDSGGPLVSNDELFGIISFSFQCADGVPDVHTKVYSYLDFIRGHLLD
ncbi:PREDICTED: chymotrypsin-1-like [Ceratosolen solmsi marchali]|uniref:Chymotrypsin-1-like n=1 Tax=Ceratosolen solmsi marchali TaxID=326594 RepID=A0AAJ6YGH5_9HYME|nr:PREDICTED: chymotrypsin-1-like [Ceratosolen solmsi marchali]